MCENENLHSPSKMSACWPVPREIAEEGSEQQLLCSPVCGTSALLLPPPYSQLPGDGPGSEPHRHSPLHTGLRGVQWWGCSLGRAVGPRAGPEAALGLEQCTSECPGQTEAQCSPLCLAKAPVGGGETEEGSVGHGSLCPCSPLPGSLLPTPRTPRLGTL